MPCWHGCRRGWRRRSSSGCFHGSGGPPALAGLHSAGIRNPRPACVVAGDQEPRRRHSPTPRARPQLAPARPVSGPTTGCRKGPSVRVPRQPVPAAPRIAAPLWPYRKIRQGHAADQPVADSALSGFFQARRRCICQSLHACIIRCGWVIFSAAQRAFLFPAPGASASTAAMPTELFTDRTLWITGIHSTCRRPDSR